MTYTIIEAPGNGWLSGSERLTAAQPLTLMAAGIRWTSC